MSLPQFAQYFYYMQRCCDFYLQESFSKEEWTQLEEAAIYAKVVKVKVDVWYSSQCSHALAAGFMQNTFVREVKLTSVPQELVEIVKTTLSTNPALTVDVKSTL